jgi:hypothetical protein
MWMVAPWYWNSWSRGGRSRSYGGGSCSKIIFEVEVDVVVAMEEGVVPKSSWRADGCTKLSCVQPEKSLDAGCPTWRTHWTPGRSRDDEDDGVVGRINELQPTPIHLQHLQCQRLGGWWTMRLKPSTSVTTRIGHEWCHYLDERRLWQRWLD